MAEGRWRRGGRITAIHIVNLQISEVSEIPVERVEFAKVCEDNCDRLCSQHGSPVWLPLVYPELRLFPE